MFWTNTQRIFKSGFQGFWRNGFVTAASILVMVITLFVIGSTIFIQAVLDSSLAQIQDKVDVNIYFVPDASEADILALKSDIDDLPEVAETEYVPKDEVLLGFQERHSEDELTLQALRELGENPFGAVLNIQAKEASQYQTISDFLESDAALTASGEDIIENANFFRNKEVIDKLSQIIDSTQNLSFLITVVLVLLSLVITYNTVRLAIFTHKEEINVMKLVGASNSYIRGPFVVEGVMYGVTAAIFTLLLFYPVTFLIGDSTEKFFVSFNLFNYYLNNFGQIFLIILASGALIGAAASFAAVRRHLKV